MRGYICLPKSSAGPAGKATLFRLQYPLRDNGSIADHETMQLKRHMLVSQVRAVRDGTELITTRKTTPYIHDLKFMQTPCRKAVQLHDLIWALVLHASVLCVEIRLTVPHDPTVR